EVRDARLAGAEPGGGHPRDSGRRARRRSGPVSPFGPTCLTARGRPGTRRGHGLAVGGRVPSWCAGSAEGALHVGLRVVVRAVEALGVAVVDPDRESVV